MSQKTYYVVSGVLFAVIAVLHVLRFVFRWEAVIGGLSIPFWVSGFAILIFGYLAYTAFKLTKLPQGS